MIPRGSLHGSLSDAGDETHMSLLLAAAQAAAQGEDAPHGATFSSSGDMVGSGESIPPGGFMDDLRHPQRTLDAEPALLQAAQLMCLDLVRASPLFSDSAGAGQAVVVLDTGADLDHSFFEPAANGVSHRIIFQQNFWGANGGPATDLDGHGTHVAGIIGSQNATHMGVAPGSSLIILRVLNPSGSSTDIESLPRISCGTCDAA